MTAPGARPNVILLSSVLPYLPDPWSVLHELTTVNADTLILDRNSFLKTGDKERIRLQHVPPSIYKATYPCRIFNEAALCRFVSSRSYELMERFECIDGFDQDTYWTGHVFRLKLDS